MRELPAGPQRRHVHASGRGGDDVSDRKEARRRGSRAQRRAQRASVLVGSVKLSVASLWTFSVVAALALDIVGDIFQNQAPEFPLGPLLFVSIAFTLLATTLMLVLGKWGHKEFSVVQPFVGGQTFVAMQMAGYMLVVVAAAVKVVLVQDVYHHKEVSQGSVDGPADYAHRYGAFGVLGAFSALGEITLMASLFFFVPPKESTEAEGTSVVATSTSLHPASTLRRDSVVVLLYCTVIIICSAVAEGHPRFRSVNIVALVTFLAISLVTMQMRMCPQITPGLNLLLPITQPSPRRYRVLLLHVVANALLGLATYGILLLYNAGYSAPQSWHLPCGLLSVLTICVYLTVLYLSRPRSTTPSVATAATEGVGSSGDVEAVAEEPIVTASYSPWLSTIVSFTLAGPIYALTYVLLSGYSEAPAEATVSGGFTITEEVTYARQGLLQMQALFVSLMLALPPFTHLQGRLIFGGRYEVWNPFGGNKDFILLQCVGWTCYAVALFMGTVHLTERRHMNFLLVATTGLLVSQMAIHASLEVFDGGKSTAAVVMSAISAPSNDEKSATGKSSGTSAETAGQLPPSQTPEESPAEAVLSPNGASAPKVDITSEETRSLISTVVNGEMLLAIVFTLTSLLLRILCDTVLYIGQRRELSTRVPVKPTICVATSLNLCSGPIAQLSMRDRVPLILSSKPSRRHHGLLQGDASGGFMALVTFGWTVYAALAVTTCILWVTGDSKDFSYFGKDVYLFSEYTCQGLMFAIPVLCFIIASYLYTSTDVADCKTRDKVRLAMAEVKSLFEKVSVGGESDPAVGKRQHRRVDRLLRIIAGNRLEGADEDGRSTCDNKDGGDDDEDADAQKASQDESAVSNGAYYVTTIMCLATSAAFASAAFVGDTQPAVGLVFSGAGVVVASLSCFSIHCVYGQKLHSRSGKYSFFMPFAGGSDFAFYQALGWISYTMCNCLGIACVVEGRGTTWTFAVMGISSVAAQLFLMHSVPLFNPAKTPSAEDSRRSFIGRNVEGILAALTLVGTFAFARIYEAASEGRTTTHASSLVPVVICAISVSLAVPMGLVSLERQAELYGVSPWSLLWRKGDDEEALDCEERLDDGSVLYDSEYPSGVSSPFLRQMSAVSHPESSFNFTTATFSRAYTEEWSEAPLSPQVQRHHSGPGGASLAMLYSVSAVLGIFVVALFPMAGVLLVYSYAIESHSMYTAAVKIVELLAMIFVVLLVLPMLMSPAIKRSKVLLDIHSALCCWATYSIPTVTVIGGVSPPLIIPARGAWLFSINMVSMTLLSTIPNVQVLNLVFTIGSFGYFIQYHLYTCLYKGAAPFVPWQCVMDIGSGAFWLWYGRRFVGRPEITGRLQSRRATRFFRKYFFKGMSHYFSAKVICEEGSDSEESRGLPENLRYVNLSDPSNQYLFSFHPHGVYPGTAIYIPKTSLWEKAVGFNLSNYVSTHCADIVFAVPLMRDFPLCLGAMSVSRKGIESSLSKGNSPLIVTGGQAEMLLTHISDTELHLVCHHLGFIKLGMRHGVPLVPILSLSESNVLGNVRCISVQRWFLKRIGFPFPTFPFGRWYLPLPTTKRITIVVGRPIVPLPGRDNPDDPECVEEMRRRYFQHVADLFYRYREGAGYPNMVLYFHNGVDCPGFVATPTPTTKAESDVPQKEKDV